MNDEYFVAAYVRGVTGELSTRYWSRSEAKCPPPTGWARMDTALRHAGAAADDVRDGGKCRYLAVWEDEEVLAIAVERRDDGLVPTEVHQVWPRGRSTFTQAARLVLTENGDLVYVVDLGIELGG